MRRSPLPPLSRRAARAAGDSGVSSPLFLPGVARGVSQREATQRASRAAGSWHPVALGRLRSTTTGGAIAFFQALDWGTPVTRQWDLPARSWDQLSERRFRFAGGIGYLAAAAWTTAQSADRWHATRARGGSGPVAEAPWAALVKVRARVPLAVGIPGRHPPLCPGEKVGLSPGTPQAPSSVG